MIFKNLEFLGGLLQKAFSMINVEIVKYLNDLGYRDLTLGQAEMLSCLRDQKLSIVALAQQLGITKQAAGESVKQLERLQYITKTLSVQDARSSIVSLSSKGRQLIKDSQRVKQRIQDEYIKKLGKQQFESLMDNLTKIVED